MHLYKAEIASRLRTLSHSSPLISMEPLEIIILHIIHDMALVIKHSEDDICISIHKSVETELDAVGLPIKMSNYIAPTQSKRSKLEIIGWEWRFCTKQIRLKSTKLITMMEQSQCILSSEDITMR